MVSVSCITESAEMRRSCGRKLCARRLRRSDLPHFIKELPEEVGDKIAYMAESRSTTEPTFHRFSSARANSHLKPDEIEFVKQYFNDEKDMNHIDYLAHLTDFALDVPLVFETKQECKEFITKVTQNCIVKKKNVTTDVRKSVNRVKNAQSLPSLRERIHTMARAVFGSIQER